VCLLGAVGGCGRAVRNRGHARVGVVRQTRMGPCLACPVAINSAPSDGGVLSLNDFMGKSLVLASPA